MLQTDYFVDERNAVWFYRGEGQTWQRGDEAFAGSAEPWECKPVEVRVMPDDYGDGIQRNAFIVQSVFRSKDKWSSDLLLDSYIDRDSFELVRKVMNWTDVRLDGYLQRAYFRRTECDFSDWNLTVLVPLDLPPYERVSGASLD